MKPKQKYLQLLQEKARRKAVSDYKTYVEYVHEGRWIPGKHLVYVCDEVQSFIETNTGHAFDVLILQMPPQHGKSQSVTETLPSWYLGKWQHKRVIEASYNDTFAQKFGRRNRDKIKRFGSKLFNLELSKVKDSNEEFEINNGVGGMISRGIMSGITGNPAELIIIDDPIKNRQEADSETYRNNLWDEWDNSIKTRCAAGAKVIVIMTRWHEDDIAGRMIKNLKNVKVINLPCEAEENDILGRTKGDALFPEIGKDNKWKDEFKESYTTLEGNRAWLALFQGRPTAEEGNMIKRHWWKYYDTLPDMIQTIMSVDAAFKDEETSDFTCVQVWGKRDADMYLIDCVNERMDFPKTLQKILEIKDKYPKTAQILVEDKANGSAIIQMLRRRIPGIIPINPEGGKVSRVNAVSPSIESGNVWLPKSSTWLNDFVEQCSAFPNAKNDDMVDAMSQALNRFIFWYANVPGVNKRDDFFNREPEDSFELDQSYIDMNVRGR